MANQELSEEARQAVRQWVNEGQPLAEVQRRLKEEHGVAMTYMDVRLLVDDMDLAPPEPEGKPGEQDLDISGQKASAAGPAGDAPGEASAAGGDGVDEPEVVGGGGAGSVSVEVDSVMRPGAVVSGSVTFSDGEKMGWQIDQSGQLGLIPGSNESYRPSQEDIEAFQNELQSVLQKQGF